MKYDARLDHHSDEYVGLEECYNGMDANDYAFEQALHAMNI